MLTLLLSSLFLQPAPTAPIKVDVDAREVTRSIFHVTERIPHGAGPVKLFYPKWIPGEHMPSGPINSVIKMRVTSGGNLVPWKRDLLNMFEIDAVLPAGATEVTVEFDDTVALPTLFGEIGSANLCRVKWNRLLWFPGPVPSDSLQIAASITLPQGWTMATALDVQKKEGDTLVFKPVSLTRLVDSPGEIGRYFRSFDVTGASSVRHTLDVMADSPSLITRNFSLVEPTSTSRG